MSLTKEYKSSPEIKKGGVHCSCCNDYHGKSRRKPYRNLRRKAKQQLRTLEN